MPSCLAVFWKLRRSSLLAGEDAKLVFVVVAKYSGRPVAIDFPGDYRNVCWRLCARERLVVPPACPRFEILCLLKNPDVTDVRAVSTPDLGAL